MVTGSSSIQIISFGIDFDVSNTTRDPSVRERAVLVLHALSLLFTDRVLKRFKQLVSINDQSRDISKWRLSKKQAVNMNELYVSEKQYALTRC